MKLLDDILYSIYAFLYYLSLKRYEKWYNLNVALDKKCTSYEFKYWKGKKKIDE